MEKAKAYQTADSSARLRSTATRSERPSTRCPLSPRYHRLAGQSRGSTATGALPYDRGTGPKNTTSEGGCENSSSGSTPKDPIAAYVDRSLDPTTPIGDEWPRVAMLAFTLLCTRWACFAWLIRDQDLLDAVRLGLSRDRVRRENDKTACTDIGIWPCPVTKIIGSSLSAAASSR